jgi:putative tryptophan/tyrosine transport system substrate-binding protein
MKRREFLAGLGGAVAWPMAARAQKRTMPVIGFLAVGPNGPNRWGASFFQGLKEAGYVDGRNVAIEYRGGSLRIDRLTELAKELVHQQVAVILTSNDGPALAAKRATSTIPIVFFNIGSDPVTLGLIESLNRPGGNVTGATFDNPRDVTGTFDGDMIAAQNGISRLQLADTFSATTMTPRPSLNHCGKRITLSCEIQLRR